MEVGNIKLSSYNKDQYALIFGDNGGSRIGITEYNGIVDVIANDLYLNGKPLPTGSFTCTCPTGSTPIEPDPVPEPVYENFTIAYTMLPSVHSSTVYDIGQPIYGIFSGTTDLTIHYLNHIEFKITSIGTKYKFGPTGKYYDPTTNVKVWVDDELKWDIGGGLYFVTPFLVCNKIQVETTSPDDLDSLAITGQIKYYKVN